MTIDLQQLPAALQAYKNQILASAKPSIEMQLSPSEDLNLWQSKVGGEPYLPLTASYPVDREGRPLKLLAQLNFSEMPAHPDFPSTGILQFFIGTDDLYGADFDEPRLQQDFRVQYFEQVTQDLAQLHQVFPSSSNADEVYSPLTGQYALTFNPTEQYISIEDTHFGRQILAVDQVFDFEEQFEGEDFYEECYAPYADLCPANGHRIGGYPFFTQSDPREFNPTIQDYVLLLQIDSDTDNGVDIMWGDCGVGNFFIHPNDLKNRDFSKVLYNWDCS